MLARVFAFIVLFMMGVGTNAQGRVDVRDTKKDGTDVRPQTRSVPGSGSGFRSGGFHGGFSSGPALGSWNNDGVPADVPKPIDVETRRSARRQGLVHVNFDRRTDGTLAEAHFRIRPDGIEQPGREIAGMQWLPKVIDKPPTTAAANEAAALQASTRNVPPWLENFRKH